MDSLALRNRRWYYHTRALLGYALFLMICTIIGRLIAGN